MRCGRARLPRRRGVPLSLFFSGDSSQFPLCPSKLDHRLPAASTPFLGSKLGTIGGIGNDFPWLPLAMALYQYWSEIEKSPSNYTIFDSWCFGQIGVVPICWFGRRGFFKYKFPIGHSGHLRSIQSHPTKMPRKYKGWEMA